MLRIINSDTKKDAQQERCSWSEVRSNAGIYKRYTYNGNEVDGYYVTVLPYFVLYICSIMDGSATTSITDVSECPHDVSEGLYYRRLDNVEINLEFFNV